MLGKKLGHKVKPYSRGHSFNPKFMQLCKNVNHHNVYVKFETGSCRVKTRSLGQTLEKHCVHSRGHSFDSKSMQLNQNANDHNI